MRPPTIFGMGPGAGRRGDRARNQAARRRRLALEHLETRQLLATLPSPTVLDRTSLSALVGANAGHESAPQIAVNPTNPQNLAAVWVRSFANPSDTDVFVELAVSFDGGVSWSARSTPGVANDPTTSNPVRNFPIVSDPSVAFDQAGNLYMLSLQRTASSDAGRVVLAQYGAGGQGAMTTTNVYTWNRGSNGVAGSKAVWKPTLAVDATQAFTDPASPGFTQTSPFQNRVYVAWVADTPVPNPNPGNWNPYTIELVNSGDNFAAPLVLNAGGNSLTGGQHTAPRIAISQGGRVGTPGQVTVVWEDFFSEVSGFDPPRGVIRTARSTDGGVSVAGRSSITTSNANRPVVGNLTGGALGTAVTPLGIGAAPVIASDNTLGAFSPFQGRLYIAYTGRDERYSGNPDANTDIFLSFSDNGGASWSSPQRVNDDWAEVDGFSEAGFSGGTTLSGRGQFQPQVAVDQATGTLVMSWFDLRHDAAQLRPATVMTTSIDGGATFSDQTQSFVNRPVAATDLATRETVIIQPIPDNQSANGNREAAFGFGHQQGLTVFGGLVYSLWSSDENGGNSGLNNTGNQLDARLARIAIGGGPRVETGASGPVTAANGVVGPDGALQLTSFTVQFDRRVDPNSFTGADVTIVGLSPNGSVINTGINAANTIVTALNANAYGATQFLVSFPAQAAAGTYSYAIGPNVSDRIRVRAGAVVRNGNEMDQDADAVRGEAQQDRYSRPGTLNGTPFSGPYDRDTLPLIVAGPRAISTSVPGVADSADNLSLNRPVGALDVTFDRDMQVSTFNSADIIRVVGPAGEISQPVRYDSTSPVLGIPENGAVLRSQITVNRIGAFSIADLDVRVNLTHGRLSDLKLELVGPDGTRVPLALAGGLSGANLSNTTFNDEATLSLSQGTAPYSGSFRPAGFGAGAPLSSFDGKDLEGVWTLEVTDTVAGTTGTLQNWSLTAAPLIRYTVTPAYNAVLPAGGSPVLDNGSLLVSTLTVPDDGGAFTISDLNVRLGLSHPRVSDLVVTLVYHPGQADEVRIPLVNNTALAGANFSDTVFDDDAASAITGGAAPFRGSFRPAGGIQLDALLAGRQLRGTWQLEVQDTVLNGQGGTLQSWSLEATPQLAGAGVSARTFRVTFPEQGLSGTYSIEIGPDILSRVGNYAVDTDQDAGVDALRQVASSTQDILVNAQQAPLAIPAGAAGSPSVTTSTLTVTDDFTIQDVDLKLRIAFPLASQLEIYLITPRGESIRLVRSVDSVGTLANFTDTTFDDEATTPIENGVPPFNARYRPQERLDLLDGRSTLDAGGVYTLRIVNNSPTQSGTLEAWSLTLKKAVSITGLGEAVADRISASFRIFALAGDDPQASTSWTPVGPAAIDNDGRAGRMSAIAVDPSDTSGNTVYAGAATGGVWKTTNFLTTDPNGPVWLPLTDFGPTSGLNIGAIAIFPQNNDPSQSIIFAATGEGADNTRGVGILRSTDGGATWTLLTSTNNAPPLAGRPNTSLAAANGAFKLAVDPSRGPSGVIVFAAMSNGLWRSRDTGQTWELVQAGNATDVVFDEFSGTVDALNPNGNLQIVYAAIAGQGVIRSVNAGNSWSLINGGIGKPNERDLDTTTAPAIGVATNPNPNGAGTGRILLAKPDLVPLGESDAFRKNTLYQGWLYALVSTGGTANLYMTKDQGRNWVLIQLPNQTAGVNALIPSNNTSLADVPIRSNALSLAVDPTNPNIVYIGTTNYPSVVRVDTTAVHDAHAFYLDNNQADGGLKTRNTVGPVQIRTDSLGDSTGFFDPRVNPYINLLRNPDGPLGDLPFAVPGGPLDGSATFYVSRLAPTGIINSGAGATWTRFETPILFASPRGGVETTFNVNQIVSIRDPLTGQARLIFGNSQGIYTGVDDGEGGLITSVGTAGAPLGSRNGNLQTAQFYYGAVQPSSVDINGNAFAALLYGSTRESGGLQSTGSILDTGYLTWNGPAPGYSAAGVATDQQGTGAQFQYWYPYATGNNQTAGGNTTDFFQVAPTGNSGLDIFGGGAVSRTDGLIQGAGDPQWQNNPNINLAVNPLSSQQIVLSSGTGRVYRTQDQGLTWQDIGPVNPANLQTQPLDGSLIRALAFGAPDPALMGDSIDDFIYAGTFNGSVFVTIDGGRNWRNISSGLAGSGRVMSIVASPSRGSHEVYAVTERGVFYMADSQAASPTWVNVTGGLFSTPQEAFGSEALSAPKLTFLTSLAVDWRYRIPDAGNPSSVHPILYTAGDAGVYRSLDRGATWNLFPAEVDGAAIDGGYLPNVLVNDLDLSVGAIDPATGQAIPNSSSPNILIASTYGRGAFGIRLSPLVLANELRFAPGSDSGASATDRVTNVVRPTILGRSQASVGGGVITVELIDRTDPTNPVVIGTATTGPEGDFSITVIAGHFLTDGSTDGEKILAVQAIDASGFRGPLSEFRFTLDTVAPGAPATPDLQAGSDSGRSNADNITNDNSPTFDVATPEPDTTVLSLLRNGTTVATRNGGGTIGDPGPVTPDGTYAYTARLVDLAGNVSESSGVLTVVVDTTPPAVPAPPTLRDQDDSGVKGDNITNNVRPRLDGVAEANSIVELLSSDDTVIAQVTVGSSGSYTLQPAADLAEGTYSLRVRSTDVAGNASVSTSTLALTIQTRVPGTNPSPGVTLPTIALVAADDSPGPPALLDNITNNVRPRFTGLGVPGLTVELIRAGDGFVYGTALVNPDGTYVVRPAAGTPLPEGPNQLRARLRDAANNTADSPAITVTIDTIGPANGPAVTLRPVDDTGVKGDNATALRRPLFVGTSDEFGAVVELINAATGAVLSRATTGADGSFTLELPQDLGNGQLVLQARLRDAAGNQGPLSSPLTVRILSALDDFDNDAKSDPTTFRPSNGQWSILQSGAGIRLGTLGQAGDVPIRADFDGDGKADLAVWRPSTSQFLEILSSGQTRVIQFGQPNVDIPAVADYDGDGRADIAVFRPTIGAWFFSRTTAGPGITGFGRTDSLPVPGDYDGDFKADLATYQPGTGTWDIQLSSGGTRTYRFGRPNEDQPLPGDWDGDGKADLAVFRPSTGQWFVYQSSNGAIPVTQFGAPSHDVPTPADYDGDGKLDLSVYRPSTRQYLTLLSGGGVSVPTIPGSVAGDLPIEAPFSYLRSRGTRLTPAVSFSSSVSTRAAGGSAAATSSSVVGVPAATGTGNVNNVESARAFDLGRTASGFQAAVQVPAQSTVGGLASLRRARLRARLGR